MVRAWRSGKIVSRDLPYAEPEPPAAFMLVMSARIITLLFCLWIAAGYSPHDALTWLGIDRIFAKSE